MDKSIRLNISGMTCVNCQNKIKKTLNHTKGIISASVSYNNATADIVYDEERISRKEIIAAVESLGYEVILRKRAVQAEHYKYRLYAGNHRFAVCHAAVDGYFEPAGTEPACRHKDGIRVKMSLNLRLPKLARFVTAAGWV